LGPRPIFLTIVSASAYYAGRNDGEADWAQGASNFKNQNQRNDDEQIGVSCTGLANQTNNWNHVSCVESHTFWTEQSGHDEFLSREADGRRNVFASHLRVASAVRGQSFGRCLKRPPKRARHKSRLFGGMQSVKKKHQDNH